MFMNHVMHIKTKDNTKKGKCFNLFPVLSLTLMAQHRKVCPFTSDESRVSHINHSSKLSQRPVMHEISKTRDQ